MAQLMGLPTLTQQQDGTEGPDHDGDGHHGGSGGGAVAAVTTLVVVAAKIGLPKDDIQFNVVSKAQWEPGILKMHKV
jgi:hypothetical protein